MNTTAKTKLTFLESLLDVDLKYSLKGTPHLVKKLDCRPHPFSICYFKKQIVLESFILTEFLIQDKRNGLFIQFKKFLIFLIIDLKLFF